MNQSSFYDSALFFEIEVDASWISQKLQHHWLWMFYISAIYLAVVFGLKKYMENRPRIELKKIVASWNLFICFVNINGLGRMTYFLFKDLYSNGINFIICDSNYYSHPAQSYWCFIFSIFKIFEMLDTVFLVLRKHDLIFLHWFHHITVLWFVWLNYMQLTAPSRCYACINSLAHLLMYSYYFLRVVGFKVPRGVAMSITLLQITQFIFGLVVIFLSVRVLNQGYPCANNYMTLYLGLVMYASYLVLFSFFFIRTYFGKSKSKAKSS